MSTVWLAKMSSASTWTTKSTSDDPTSCTGSGLTVTMMLGGVAPPVPPVPPPPPALQAARCACLVQLGAALTFAEATPAMPTRGMATTTVSATNRARRLLRTFIGFLLLVDGYLSAGGLRPGVVVASPSLVGLLIGITYSAFSKVTGLSDIATFRDLVVESLSPVTSISEIDGTNSQILGVSPLIVLE